MGADLIKKIEAWESMLVEGRSKNGQDVINWPNRLNADLFDLRSGMDSQDPRVTQGARDRLKDLEAEWDKHRNAMKELQGTHIAAYNEAFRNQQIPALILPQEGK
jgi:hypothetical protein